MLSLRSSAPKAAALRLLLAVCAGPWFTAQARAELPPEAYRQEQSEAAEALEIKVRSVKSSKSRKARETVVANEVEADVQKVVRSATGLKPGAVIKIRYTQRVPDQPMPGPSEVPTLKQGQVRPAYLSRAKDGKSYTPAAGGYTFETVPSR